MNSCSSSRLPPQHQHQPFRQRPSPDSNQAPVPHHQQQGEHSHDYPNRPPQAQPTHPHTPPQQRTTYVHQPYYPVFGEADVNEPRPTASLSTLRPPSMDYGTPPTASLGTPHIGSTAWGCAQGGPTRHSVASSAGRQSGRGRSRHAMVLASSPGSSTSAGKHFTQEELEQITLIPTRPLLKALAKHSRPFAPWCVGCPPGTSFRLDEELMRFRHFVNPTAAEITMDEAAERFAADICQSVWPGAELIPMAATAAGQPRTKLATVHLFARQSTDEGDVTKGKITDAVSKRGGNVEFAVDDRAVPCALCTDSRSGKRFCIRYGRAAESAAASARVLSEAIANVPSRQATLCALLALLEQNKVLDDTGIRKGQLGGEAVAAMLLSVANSYEPGDEPDSGRLLRDFFLTFGFQSNFDYATSCVTSEGLCRRVPKVHPNAQLDVLDPGDNETNLTPNVDRAANLQAVFNYCYTALSQYQQVSTNQRRAQSALSTIIGGEPFWGRVLMMHQEGVEPFYSAVQAKKAALALNL